MDRKTYEIPAENLETPVPRMRPLLRVLFLDVDGVLNSNEFFARAIANNNGQPIPMGARHLDPEAVRRVQQLVQKTRATVVLSSTWRYGWPIMTISQWLGVRIYGATAVERFRGNRSTEIDGWLDRFRPDRYAILDDDRDIYGHDDHFVQTDVRVGLTDDDCRRVARILR